jgi:hypothetical protein
MPSFRLIRIFTVFLASITAIAISAHADVPVTSNVMVTDVTPTSFSVVWSASEASKPGLNVFYAEDGATIVEDAVVVAHPVNDSTNEAAIIEAAENRGVMKVMVAGLEPDTSYYFQTITTSKSTLETTFEPASAPFAEITTEVEAVRTYQDEEDIMPFSNDIILEPCYLDDGATAADGTLLIATVAGANYPISAFVGDGIESPYALIDLNNVYSRDDYENLNVAQGENLTLLNYRGLSGYSVVTYDIPEDQTLCEVKRAGSSLKIGWNMFSSQLDPVDTDVLSVLSPIIDGMEAIWAYDASEDHWYRYDQTNPFPWLNDLDEVQSNVGYWIVMNQESALKVNGAFSSESIELKTGWNFVGGKPIDTLPVLEAFGSVAENLVAVWHYETETGNWLKYDNENPLSSLNDLKYIESGKGYWVVVDQDCTW